MFTITGNGFHMDFANGCTVSVQWNTGNYCDNQMARQASDQSRTAEVAAWDVRGDWILPDQVAGWQTPEQVAAFIMEIASR